MENICYIIGASLSIDAINIDPSDGDLLIAADGGLSYLEKLSLKADIILGDFDSLGNIPQGPNVIRYPVEKDETDMFIAVKTGLEKNYKKFIIYGGLGGRLDHTYANIQILSFLSRNNAIGYLVGEGQVVTAITNGGLELDKDNKGYISVFSNGDEAKGVNISGLKYELNHARLSCVVPLGISNEFIGRDSFISVDKGTLIIMWNKSPNELINYISKRN